MKSHIPLVLLVTAGLVISQTACEELLSEKQTKTPQSLGTPLDYPPVVNLVYEVTADLDGNPGGGLHLDWDAPVGGTPDEYVVTVDGIDQVAVITTEDWVFQPGAGVAVYAVYGTQRSEPATLDFKAVETPELEVYSVDDPDPGHPAGFGFSLNGTATSYSLSSQSNWPMIDFWVASGPKLASPSDHVPTPINPEVNAISVEEGLYKDLDIVGPTGQGLYATNRDLMVHELYGLWIDPTNDGHSIDDNFAKTEVLEIEGTKVTLKLAFQTAGGLRWVVTDEGTGAIIED